MILRLLDVRALLLFVCLSACSVDVSCPTGWTVTAATCECPRGTCTGAADDGGVEAGSHLDAAGDGAHTAGERNRAGSMDAEVVPLDPVVGARPPEANRQGSTPSPSGPAGVAQAPRPMATPAPIPTAGPCGDFAGIPESERCDDGNDNPYDGCVNCRKARCGDGFLFHEGEECDRIRGSNLVAAWTAQTCTFEPSCKRKIYTVCDANSPTDQCPTGDVCSLGVCAPATCVPGFPNCRLPPCPPFPGRSTPPTIRGAWCYIGCGGAEACPVGLVCDEELRVCVGPTYYETPIPP